MISQLKERLGTQLTFQQYASVASYISSFSYSTTVSIASASLLLEINIELMEDVLNTLTDIGTLQRDHVIRCPECLFLIETIKAVEITNDFFKKIYCHCCENDIEADASDVDVFYSLTKNN